MAIERPHRFNVEDYYRMADAGILTEDDRVELIEGEIADMPPIGSPHAGTVDRIVRLFFKNLMDRVIVRSQNPVRLGQDSEPQPDIALLKPREDFYTKAHPGPSDVLLVVEVADTTVQYDRETKLPLYACSGISEAWIVNLVSLRIEAYWEPFPEGYRQQTFYQRGQRISPQAFPDLDLVVEDILG
jgi:Uma2 family endonuclease